jgi:squalene-hopene/tetraprenyl-beta-curcumene cyclase
MMVAASLPAQDSAAPSQEQMVARAIDFLKIKGQRENGAYEEEGVGVTALVTAALLRHGRTPQDPMIAKSLKYLEANVKEDGGVYTGPNYKNYETCLSIMCFSEANKDGRYDKIIKNADAFVKGIQWDESEDKDKSDPAFGGAGYGSHKRPDLSNTTFLIDALKAAGNDANSEAMQKALVFVSRCQNLETEHNTTAFAAKVNDGGFYYTIAAGGSSQAGPTADGGLRSYGSMTYAGLKSMIYAGVKKDDPRVTAAVGWIKKNYDLDSNPGMGAGDAALKAAGLFYYYNTFAKSLSAMGIDELETADGKKHNWRAELVAELASRQQKDGSWMNSESSKWREQDPNLATGYALLALSYCK